LPKQTLDSNIYCSSRLDQIIECLECNQCSECLDKDQVPVKCRVIKCLEAQDKLASMKMLVY
jgi:hypothetical protein